MKPKAEGSFFRKEGNRSFLALLFAMWLSWLLF